MTFEIILFQPKRITTTVFKSVMPSNVLLYGQSRAIKVVIVYVGCMAQLSTQCI